MYLFDHDEVMTLNFTHLTRRTRGPRGKVAIAIMIDHPL